MMAPEEMYVNERLDHLGIVAGVCQEIGLAGWLDAQEPGSRQQVSVGTATVAMILNGLGFSNRQLYLVPQFFANKPVEHLLGPGITAEMLNDDCLGRTLDWLYAHDLTRLFAGIASRARQIFGITAEQVHVDTTSFSVSGEYAGAEEAKEAVIAITYGYSRDHRADLKQWMRALATTHDGDVPLFLQPLDGNSSDKVSLPEAIGTIQTQLREVGEEASVYVADNGVYSEPNIRQLNQAGVKWVSRVSGTLTEAKMLLQAGSATWQHIVGTNVLEPTVLSDQHLITTYKGQGSPERGFRFLKDPLFLASSVFVKKPERLMALSFIMVLCLLVYRLAEVRLRARLAETQQTIADQVHKPTARPTMRWVFQCFEGVELLQVQTDAVSLTIVLRLQPLHRLILALLGPLYEQIYNPSG